MAHGAATAGGGEIAMTQDSGRLRGPARLWAAWCWFWFSPADPTPLCLMRIVTGLLVLYVHVAYTFDLQSLFGPDGWYPTAMADRERREYPVFVPSSEWAPRTPFRMPENGDQRHALRVFIENLAAEPAKQDQALLLLTTLPAGDPEAWQGTMEFLRKLPRDPGEREDKLRNLVKAPPADDPDVQKYALNEALYGRYLLGLNTKLREQFRINAHALAETLPADPAERRELFTLLMQERARGIEILTIFVRHVTEKYPAAADRKAYLDFTEYWSPPPDDPDLLYKGHPVYSPFFHVTTPTGIDVLHGVHLAIIVLFTIGFCTRVTSVLTWLAALAYVQRNPLSLFGQDTMMNLCLFYLMLAPCGATWSVDWLINRYRAGRAALMAGQRPPADIRPRPLISANVVIRLLQVQYCLMYMSAGMSKLKGNSWWTGTAVWYTMTNPEFSPLHIPLFRNVLVWLCQDENRWLWEGYMNVMNVFTLGLEIGLPFLVWTRLRPIWIFGAILLHMGIALNMGLVVFSLFMFALLLAWMPPDAIRRVFARPPGRLPKLEVRFNAQDPRQRRAAAVIYAADVWSQTELEDQALSGNLEPGDKPMTVVAGGESATGVAGACRLVRDLGLTQPIGWWLLCPLLHLPGLSHLVAALFGSTSSTTQTAVVDGKRPKPITTR
jgi:hypothetical protein